MPYHNKLEQLIDNAHYNYGHSYHINCHSMPSEKALNNFNRSRVFKTPDFVLGDRNGTSCDLAFTHSIRDYLESLGYNVAINNPYRGVELVERYSAPSKGYHSIQIEISRALYMDEDACTKNNNFSALKKDINKLIEFCIRYSKQHTTQIAAD